MKLEIELDQQFKIKALILLGRLREAYKNGASDDELMDMIKKFNGRASDEEIVNERIERLL